MLKRGIEQLLFQQYDRLVRSLNSLSILITQYMTKHISQTIIIVIFLTIQQLKAEFPPFVWIFWDSGFQSMPKFTKICLQKNINILNSTKWQIKEVNRTNIPLYLDKQEIKTLQQLFIYNTPVQIKSDFVRLSLLNKYGGVYMDASGYLVEDLNWLDHLSTNPLQMYQIGEQIQFFAFLNIDDGQHNIFSSRRQVINKGKLQNSFMAAKPNSTFGVAWINKLIELARSARKNNKDYNYWMSFDAQFDLFRQKNWEIIKGIDKVSKNFEKAYKLATINSNEGMYYRDYAYKSSSQQVFNKITAEQLKERYNFQAKYYVKHNHFESQFLYTYFQNQQKAEQKADQQLLPMQYQNQKIFNYFPSLSCLRSKYILQGSITYNNLITPANYYPSKVVKRENLPLLCQYNLNIQQLKLKFQTFLIYPIIFGVFLLTYIKISQILASKQQKKALENLSQIPSAEFNEKSDNNDEMIEISSSKFIFEFAKIEEIFWVFVIGYDIIQKILFAGILLCYYSTIVLFVDIIAIIGLLVHFNKEINFIRMVIFDSFVTIYGIISLYLHQQTLKELSGSNQFHKNTLLRMTIRHIFLFRYFLYGFIFFRVCVIAWIKIEFKSRKSNILKRIPTAEPFPEH